MPILPVNWLRTRPYGVLYIGCAAAFLLFLWGRWDSRTHGSSLLLFGDQFAAGRVRELDGLPLHTLRRSAGYDGQFYAQIAVIGNPFDAQLSAALDNPAYRTRRSLLPVLCHLIGLGRPALVLASYALSNVVCWVLLALLTARWWFPPVSFDNLLRWLGVVFGAGMMVSVARGLTDGPALLLIACGVRSLEVRRRWLAALLLGAAGLVRESSVLGAAIFFPSTRRAQAASALGARPASAPTTDRPLPAWLASALFIAVCTVPMVSWVAIVSLHYGGLSGGALGAPFVGLVREGLRLVTRLRQGWSPRVEDELAVLLSLVVQVSFLVARPRPSEPWWRVGAAFALLGCFLGWDFWRDALSGVPRTLLPLTLAFNILAPKGRAGFALLVLGNLTVLPVPRFLDTIPHPSPALAEGIAVEYGDGWYDEERVDSHTWRWASGPARLVLRNSRDGVVRLTLVLDLLARGPRTVSIRCGATRRTFALGGVDGVRAAFGPVDFPPGELSFFFESPGAPWVEPHPNGRPLAFAAQDLRLEVSP